jgi:hypothetical protein
MKTDSCLIVTKPRFAISTGFLAAINAVNRGIIGSSIRPAVHTVTGAVVLAVAVGRATIMRARGVL